MTKINGNLSVKGVNMNQTVFNSGSMIIPMNQLRVEKQPTTSLRLSSEDIEITPFRTIRNKSPLAAGDTNK